MIGTCFLLLVTIAALWLYLGRGAAAAAQSEPAALHELAGKGLDLAVLMAVALVALSVAAFFPDGVLRLAGACLRILPASWNKALMGLLRSLVHALGFLKSPGRVAAALLLSFGVWLCYPLSTYVLARGFGLDLPLAGALVVQSMVTAAVAAPQAPGFIGPFQAAATAGVGLFGVSGGDAGAFGMMMWAINVVPITIVGLWYLRREGLNLRNLAQASETAADQVSIREQGQAGTGSGQA